MHIHAPLPEALAFQEAVPKVYPWTFLDLILDQIPHAKPVRLKPVSEDLVDLGEIPSKLRLPNSFQEMPHLEIEWNGPGTEPKGTWYPSRQLAEASRKSE
jgi:hypothetical protein